MLPLLSTAYLPPVSYVALLVQNKGAELEVHENFEKQSYRNRCQIFGANGLQNLTVPIIHSGKTNIRDLRISYQENWRGLHWKSILSAYKGRPFFDILAEDLKTIWDKKPVFLFDLNEQILQLIFEWIQDELNLTHSSAFKIPENDSFDFRYKLHPKKESILLNPKRYFQQFQDHNAFMPDLSVIDLIFSEGRAAWDYLNDAQLKTNF